ncbi:MAG TPA: hypothetical protein VFF79_13035 [Conexibacter sp.]|jgi:hypothetical protein|nr:hypothetical protein [Conexibacter sp.]
MTAERKTFYVERISRTVTTIAVEARSKAEAMRLARDGEGDEVDARSLVCGFGRVHAEGETGR